MIASLGMYDFGDLPEVNDRLWRAIRDNMRRAGLAAPDSLDRDAPDGWPVWQAPDLSLSQTCGYPYRARLHGQVTLVGTPDYGLAGCPPGFYRSAIVINAANPSRDLRDFDGAALAYNDAMSQSGWAAVQTHAQTCGIHLSAGEMTGGHRVSARAVAEGRAEIAALDAVTFRLMQRLEPEVVAGLHVLEFTPPTPGLPLITAKTNPKQAVFDAVAAAIASLTGQDREKLGILGLRDIAPSRYLQVPTPNSPDQIGQLSCAK